jgi:hypothetical protein
MVLPDAIKTGIGTPAARAHVAIENITTMCHEIRVTNADTPTRRALPRGSVGYAVFSATVDRGGRSPTDIRDWQFHGVGTRPTFKVTYRRGDLVSASEPATCMVVAPAFG